MDEKQEDADNLKNSSRASQAGLNSNAVHIPVTVTAPGPGETTIIPSEGGGLQAPVTPCCWAWCIGLYFQWLPYALICPVEHLFREGLFEYRFVLLSYCTSWFTTAEILDIEILFRFVGSFNRAEMS